MQLLCKRHISLAADFRNTRAADIAHEEAELRAELLSLRRWKMEAITREEKLQAKLTEVLLVVLDGKGGRGRGQREKKKRDRDQRRVIKGRGRKRDRDR
jgi:hypothetical protein